MTHLDASTEEVVGSIGLPQGAGAGWIVADDDDVWVAHSVGKNVFHIDPVGERVDATFPLPHYPQAMAILTDARDRDMLWITFY